jgi:hypothetical protein
MTNVALEAVLSNQSAGEAVTKLIGVLKEGIYLQERIIATAEAVADKAEDLGRRREDLFAEIAVGTAKPGDLVKLDAEIARKKKGFQEAEEAVAPARQALAGLRRKLGETELELEAITKERRFVREALYEFEAEKVGADYIKAAAELHAILGRLVGLNELVEERNILGFPLENYSIPVLQLQIFKGAEKCSPQLLYGGHQFGPTGAPKPTTILRAAAKERLRIMGVASIE